MDNHGSHRTPQFVLLCYRNNIVPLTFPAHLTHIMQPLDVGVFQVYKHWHNKAIERAMENLEFEYTISSFFHDLEDIRQRTFSPSTIRSAFKKAGMWPANLKVIKEFMWKYAKTTVTVEAQTESELPIIPQTPYTIRQVQIQLGQLGPKIKDALSSPSQHKYESLERGTVQVLDEGEIIALERDLLYKRVYEITNKRIHSRRRIQRGGELTGEWAQEQLERRDRIAVEKTKKKEERMLTKYVRDEKKVLKRLGIDCRRIERLRKKELEKVLPGDIGASHLYTGIPDPETISRRAHEATLTGFQLPLGYYEEVQERHMAEALVEMQEEEEVNIILSKKDKGDSHGEGFIFLDNNSDSDSSKGTSSTLSSSDDSGQEDHYLL
jgi:hypothetical protein